jgi:hypothetical protein
VILMDARAAEFHHFTTERLEWREIEFLLAVVSVCRRGFRAGLESVGADDFSRGNVLDDEVVARRVEAIGVALRAPAFAQALLKLDIEHLEAKPLGGLDVFRRRGEPRPVRDAGKRGQSLGHGRDGRRWNGLRQRIGGCGAAARIHSDCFGEDYRFWVRVKVKNA